MKPRLYIDADITPVLARLLRESGFDTVSCHEIGAADASDDWHIQRATAERRVLITFNVKDFRGIARRLAQAEVHHTGIMASHHQYTLDEIGVMRDLVVALLSDRSSDDMLDAFLILPRPRRP
jgi:uncharacterized protein with PIN domain